MTVCSTGDDASQQQQLSYLQSCGFGGSWRFTGPLNVSRQNPNNVKLLMNVKMDLKVVLIVYQEIIEHHMHLYIIIIHLDIIIAIQLHQQLVILMQDSIRSPTDRGSQAFDLNASNR
ncbi:unnamed protein product [Rotaria socialis]|uniref:Uncharacterized protein n=1 Tax=Rotaria socialis TaxID=392032 RepID=A0A817VU13_9BILA|nr:unnamed protein product [Rotaria socialis]